MRGIAFLQEIRQPSSWAADTQMGKRSAVDHFLGLKHGRGRRGAARLKCRLSRISRTRCMADMAEAGRQKSMAGLPTLCSSGKR